MAGRRRSKPSEQAKADLRARLAAFLPQIDAPTAPSPELAKELDAARGWAPGHKAIEPTPPKPAAQKGPEQLSDAERAWRALKSAPRGPLVARGSDLEAFGVPSELPDVTYTPRQVTRLYASNTPEGKRQKIAAGPAVIL